MSDKQLWRTWFPHGIVAHRNPVFKYGARHLYDRYALRKRSLLWMSFPVIGLLLFWVVMMVIWLRGDTFQNQWQNNRDFFQIMGWIGIASLGEKLIFDLIVTAISMGSASNDFTQRNRDSISMTGLSATSIIRARHAIAQIRVWRLMSLIIGLRVGVVMAYGLQIFITPAFTTVERLNFDFYSPEELITLFIAFVGVVGVTLFYIVEPRWRVRILSVGGIATIALNVRSGYRVVLGLGTVIGLWVIQVLTVVLLFGLLQGLNTSLIVDVFYDFSPMLQSLFFLALTMGGIGIIYGIYRLTGLLWYVVIKHRLIQLGSMP